MSTLIVDKIHRTDSAAPDGPQAVLLEGLRIAAAQTCSESLTYVCWTVITSGLGFYRLIKRINGANARFRLQ